MIERNFQKFQSNISVLVSWFWAIEQKTKCLNSTTHFDSHFSSLFQFQIINVSSNEWYFRPNRIQLNIENSGTNASSLINWSDRKYSNQARQSILELGKKKRGIIISIVCIIRISKRKNELFNIEKLFHPSTV